MRSRIDELLPIAEENAGFVTAAQARSLGIKDSVLARLTQRGKLQRVARGVYRIPYFPSDRLGQYREAILWARADSGPKKIALSHETALAVYGISDANPPRVQITVPKSARFRRRLGSYFDRCRGRSDGEADPVFGITIPPGYRDWKLISVAHEEGNLNDLRALLGNAVAIKAYREGKLPFPDGTVIARLAWSYVPSEENNKAFARSQSFVAGPATNVQFMVKDSKKYATTGGWGLLNSKTANLPTRRCSKPAFPATSLSKLATSSLPVTHPNYGGPVDKEESL